MVWKQYSLAWRRISGDMLTGSSLANCTFMFLAQAASWVGAIRQPLQASAIANIACTKATCIESASAQHVLRTPVSEVVIHASAVVVVLAFQPWAAQPPAAQPPGSRAASHVAGALRSHVGQGPVPSYCTQAA